MNLNINVKEREVRKDCFDFGNIENDYGANSVYFTKKEKPFIPLSGEFHYSRYDHRQWKVELLKMKASGLNAVATYVFWNHHEYVRGEYDFSGDRNIHEFLRICREIDFPCVLRMGPWSHGECLWGGFPSFIQKMNGKRTDNAQYLAEVEIYWTRLFQEVKEFCDGKTIIAVQLENEYTKGVGHLQTLLALAVKIGFKAPFFTVTAWPVSAPDKRLLQTHGGYPEAPWTYHKRPLTPNGRFAISGKKTANDIGSDLFKSQNGEICSNDFPYAGCEVGPGNQVTAHRRPNINDKDGYGVAFAKFASEMNWMGYYMYHGGRNPGNHLYQESKRTFYPNNYPIIDYDFQSPFSKDGEYRAQGHRLRLLHTFISTFDENLATKQAYFTTEKMNVDNSYDAPYCSVRCDTNLSGYAFFSNYERGRVSKDMDIGITVHSGDKKIVLPTIKMSAGQIIFYPFNLTVGKSKIDYILAQPITKIGNTMYFAKFDGIEPIISIGGKTEVLGAEYSVGETKIILLDNKKALNLYRFGDNVVFSENALYEDNGKIMEERKGGKIASGVTLTPVSKVSLPNNYYLYSYGKRHYYSLKIDKKLIDAEDIMIKLNFVGLNMQVFSGEQIIDDYFNTNGEYVFHTKMFKDYLKKNNELIIKAVPRTRFGVGNVYQEINMPYRSVTLTLGDVFEFKTQELK